MTEPDLPELPDATRRARAMWAYSGLKQDELAEATGIGLRRLQSLLRVKNPYALTSQELVLIAEATGTPMSFALNGFTLPTTDREAVEAAVDTLANAMDSLRERLPERIDG